MTYQSSPYYPIIFPDQAAKLNMYGYEDPKPNRFSHIDLQPAAHDSHVSWKDQADRLVYAKSRNTKSAESDMLKGPHSVKGKCYTTKRYDFVGGNVMGSSRPASIQPQLDALLKDRVEQYAGIYSAGFDAVSPERLYVPVPKVESFPVDTMFTTLFQYVDLGDLKNALKQTNIVITTLLSNADKLEKDSLDTYLGVVRKCILIAMGMDNTTDIEQARIDPELTSAPKSYTETKRMLKALIKELEGIGEFLLKFVQYANKPSTQRASLLANIRKSLLADTLKNQQTITSGEPIASMVP
jgi:hypothetical protein